jgi:hypothetical protein
MTSDLVCEECGKPAFISTSGFTDGVVHWWCRDHMTVTFDSSSKPAPIPHGEPQSRVPDEVQEKGKGAE